MPDNNKNPPPQTPGPMRWSFDPGIPTSDFFEGMSLTEIGTLQDAVEDFVYWLEQDYLLTWEAVVCEEQGLPLTAQQQVVLGGLLNFSDSADGPVLYLNDLPRPSEPWHVILNRLVPHLLIEPFRTSDLHFGVHAEGWSQIMEALEEHGQGLSLPPGAASYREVVPAELRHKLWLQYCFDILGGLGQDEGLVLEEEKPWRVDELILRLRECKESVAYFGLTLEALLGRVILPERDRPLFIKLMQQKLGLSTAQESLADRL